MVSCNAGPGLTSQCPTPGYEMQLLPVSPELDSLLQAGCLSGGCSNITLNLYANYQQFDRFFLPS